MELTARAGDSSFWDVWSKTWPTNLPLRIALEAVKGLYPSVEVNPKMVVPFSANLS
jgi:hypothetical protein